MPNAPVRVIPSNQPQDLSQSARTSLNSNSSSLWSSILPLACVTLIACSLLFANLGAFPLFNPDEALYAEPAREMLEIGDYITTYLNYVVRFTKPPVVIWGQALGILAFGCNEFAVRFFGAAAGAILVAATYCFADKLITRKAAIAASLVLASAPLFIGTAREAITDMPLALFTCSSMFCFFLAQRQRSGRGSFALWMAYILVGLAVMTKGPVGLVLPLIILFVFHALKQDLKEAFLNYKPVAGLAIVGLVSLPWFVLEIYITKGAYFNEFIMRENFQRFTSVVDSHKGPWWYHIAAMLGGFFPWSVFLPQAALGAALLPKVKERFSNSGIFSTPAAFKNLNPKEELGLYLLCWSVITLAFYSASVSKLLPYTLPAFPALALLVALEFERICEKQAARRAALPASLLVIIFASALAILPFALTRLRDAPVTLVEIVQSLVSYELVFAAAAAALAGRKFFKSAFMLFFLPTVVGFMFFGNRILTVLSQTWEEPLPAMAAFAGASDLPLLVYDMRKPSMPFYARRKVIQPSSAEELSKVLLQTRGAYILSKSKQTQFFRDLANCKVLYAEGKFILVYYKAPELPTLSSEVAEAKQLSKN